MSQSPRAAATREAHPSAVLVGCAKYGEAQHV